MVALVFAQVHPDLELYLNFPISRYQLILKIQPYSHRLTVIYAFYN